ncbi:MAG: Fertility inhibition FinO [Burkholderiaceae bacterium]|nr:MAG: Fertility inhibition FinO [Burkholderiaceae bacterium]
MGRFPLVPPPHEPARSPAAPAGRGHPVPAAAVVPEAATPPADATRGSVPPPARAARGASRKHPLLARLAECHPALFGATARPLKRGIFQDLCAAHPEFDGAELKLALAQHTRSTRYLRAVAGGEPRHDLSGAVVEPMAPEHVHHALLEVARAPRAPAPDAREDLIRRMLRAYERSSLTPAAYRERVRSRDEAANALLDEALSRAAQRAASDEALLRAFEASGASPGAFAQTYGLPVGSVREALARAAQPSTPGRARGRRARSRRLRLRQR